MLMLLIPDCRSVSITEAKTPKGTVLSQRRNMPSFGFLILDVNFGPEVVHVDWIVSQINELILVDGDDDLLFGDFMHALGLRNIDFDAGLEDGGGDHEDDQQDEHDVDERDHVDLGQGRLRRFGHLRHRFSRTARLVSRGYFG